jgi:hypothetical protein
MWGLDRDGKFMTSNTTSNSLNKLLISQLKNTNVRTQVIGDIRNAIQSCNKENDLILSKTASKEIIGKRLFYLFQKDLLPGITGQILETKNARDNAKSGTVYANAKVLCWTFVATLNAVMLFYIYLFALQQSPMRQKAWFRSFMVWLILEVLFVSTAVVYVTHFLIPSFIMNDVVKIKMKLMDTIREFRSQSMDDTKPDEFKANEYLFVSSRLAKKYPDVPESRIISRFSTPWPSHSYSQSISVSSTYSKKYSFISNSAAIILVYILKGLISMPPVLQDTLIKLLSTSGLGYVGVLLLRLYRIHPALPFVPLVLLAILIHFAILSSNQNKFLKMREIVPLVDTPKSKTKNVHVSSNQIQPMSTDNIINTEAVSGTSKVKTRRASLLAGISVVEELRQQQQNASSVEHIERALNSAIDSNEDEDVSNASEYDESHQSNGEKMLYEISSSNSSGSDDSTNDFKRLVDNMQNGMYDDDFDWNGDDMKDINDLGVEYGVENDTEDDRFEREWALRKHDARQASGEGGYSEEQKEVELAAEDYDDYMHEFMSHTKRDLMSFLDD